MSQSSRTYTGAGESAGFIYGRLDADKEISENHIELAKKIVEFLPSRSKDYSFNLIVNSGSRYLVVGYVYPAKNYGLFIFRRHTGSEIRIALDSGIYQKV